MRRWDSKLLGQLLVVQEIDLKIRGIETTVTELQQRCMREDPELNTLKAELTGIEESLESTKSQRDMYQNTLEDIRSAIKSLIANRSRAFKPRNRSSTEALRTEEEKLAVLVVETEEQIEILQKNCNSIEAQIARRSRDVQKEQHAPEAEIRHHSNQIDVLMGQREKVLKGLPTALVRKYDRLRKSRSGVGLTIMVDGICRVCRMEMPTGIKSKLLKDEPIDACPACGRMVAGIENTVDHKKLAEEARVAQEKRVKEEAARARLEEEKARAAAGEVAKQAKKDAVARQKAKAERSKAAMEAKVPAKKAPAKKAAAKKAAAKKAAAKKAAAKKAAAKKAAAKKAPAKKAAAKKVPAKKAAAKKKTKSGKKR